MPQGERKEEGFQLPSISSPRVLSLCKNLQDDEHLPTVFIASYPKSGTTWMQAIVYNLLSNGDQALDHISNYTPFYEISRTWDDDTDRPHPRYAERHDWLGARAFNTHLLPHMMPSFPKLKVIYVVRSGRDVALSFFHHLSNQDDADNYRGSLSEFLRDWIDGKIIFGEWLLHLQSWMEAFERGLADRVDGENRIMIVRYEDLCTDLAAQMVCIARFLGVTLSEERIAEVSSLVTFDYMKSHSIQYEPTSVPWKPGFEFIRQGTVGQNRSAFSPADHALFDAMIERAYPQGVPTWLADLRVL